MMVILMATVYYYTALWCCNKLQKQQNKNLKKFAKINK